MALNVGENRNAHFIVNYNDQPDSGKTAAIV